LENRKKVITKSPRSAFKKKNKAKECGASRSGVKKKKECTKARVHKMMKGGVAPSICNANISTIK
jgi:hypothetical protein